MSIKLHQPGDSLQLSSYKCLSALTILCLSCLSQAQSCGIENKKYKTGQCDVLSSFQVSRHVVMDKDPSFLEETSSIMLCASGTIPPKTQMEVSKTEYRGWRTISENRFAEAVPTKLITKKKRKETSLLSASGFWCSTEGNGVTTQGFQICLLMIMTQRMISHGISSDDDSR
ncbi:hypothetical protein Tco_0683290 [Tanacetum coccineum]|uniref:Uncharacterized protein n=1 Tax=Tanacetum coccineum TaxID=301880 RepID=A0ABQ4XV67_9ASTR